MKLNFLINPTKTFSLLAMAAVIGLSSCEDENPVPGTDPVLPTTYSFENVDYSGQTARIQQLSMLEAKAKSANDGTTKVTFDELNSIFENTSGNLAGSNKQIKDKTGPQEGGKQEAVDEIVSYFVAIDTLSGNPDNIAGGKYLVTANGIEPAQMIAKGLMGALLYYQATSVYLGDAKMSVDNTEVTEGKGTAMQHHWDEAFGYFGAPVDYLTTSAEDQKNATDPSKKAWYWAGYANGRASVVDVREDIFNAFIAGRAAIGRNDIAARDAAIATIKEKWELLAAANAVHYFNSAIEDIENNNVAAFYHHFSEGKAFLNTLKYNLDKTIKFEDINAINTLLGNNPKASFEDKDATISALEEANLKLQEVFKFTDPQMSNL